MASSDFRWKVAVLEFQGAALVEVFGILAKLRAVVDVGNLVHDYLTCVYTRHHTGNGLFQAGMKKEIIFGTLCDYSLAENGLVTIHSIRFLYAGCMYEYRMNRHKELHQHRVPLNASKTRSKQAELEAEGARYVARTPAVSCDCNLNQCVLKP